MEITLSWRTIFKVFTALLLFYLAVKLWPLAQLLLLALLVAVTFVPMLGWMAKRGWPKWVGVATASVLLFGFVALFLGIVIPTIIGQGNALIESFPKIKEQALQSLPDGPIRDSANKYLTSSPISNPEAVVQHSMVWGGAALECLVGFFIVLIVAIYFLVDGERVYKWLVAFLPLLHRRKIAVAAPELGSVVGSYMAGQLITSLLCGVYAFVVLTLLKVPNAALLAVLAGVLDVLPMIGFFLGIIPAIAFALTVSPFTAGLVALLYGTYHLFENYFVVPKVYGNRLRLSTLTVLVSCLAAGLAAGVIGAIVVLPIVASYPIVERLWLRRLLESDTVEKHEAIVEQEHPST